MKKILDEFNKTNSTNDKLEVMRKYKDDKRVKRVFHSALNKVKFVYGVKKYVSPSNHSGSITLDYALDVLEEQLAKRLVTGNKAIALVEHLLSKLSKDDAYVLERVLDRDLKINFGKTGFNKIVDKEDKINAPSYTRCEIGTEKNITKNMPIDKDGNFTDVVYSQVKMDGEFRRAVVDGDDVEMSSRPGIINKMPIIEEQIKSLDIDGYVLIGEMNMFLDKPLFEYLCDLYKSHPEVITELKKILNSDNKVLPRHISNGLINSINQK